MWRFFFRPFWQLVLPCVLIGWPIAASRISPWNEWGVLAQLGSSVSGAGAGCILYRHWDVLDVYKSGDGSLVLTTRHSPFVRPESPGPDSVLVASIIRNYSGPTGFGVVVEPVVRNRTHQHIRWELRRAPSNVTVDDISIAIESVFNQMDDPALSDAELGLLFDRGLYYTRIVNPGEPLEFDRVRYDLDYLMLGTEAAYLAFGSWWMLVFIYARKVWPKPDGSRCPSCGYELAGLVSPVCPECGKPLPLPLRQEGAPAAGG